MPSVFVFVINSILLGVGLAMDAFSVSLANGLSEPSMKKGRMFTIAGVFSLFQFAMPVIGWVCVHTIAEKFEAFQKFIPWIALILLSFIGGKMIIEGIKAKNEPESKSEPVGFVGLLVQGVATSIDALSVGFTISEYTTVMALLASLIIGVVTLAICISGLLLGRKFGTKLAGRANIMGGVILIGIGLEIFITHMI